MRINGARAFVGAAILGALGALSCGGSASHPPGATAAPTGDASDQPSGPFHEAPHTPLPQVVFHGGPLLTAPKIVTVTFPGDTNADALEAFGDSITSSAWWDEVASAFCDDTGKCVGKGASGGHVRLTSPPAATYSDTTGGGISTLQVFIADLVNAGTLPTPDANTLYVFYVPDSTRITLTESGTQTEASCAQFHAYHNALQPPSASAAYAIVQECPPGDGLTALQGLTFAASHEIIEAATDPVLRTLGYYLNLEDTSTVSWNLFAGGEAADLCVDISGLRQDQIASGGYTLQRVWSNANAAKGLDPCVPHAPSDPPYFNVATEDKSAYIVLNVGGTATFTLDAFSSAPTAPWTVEAIDWATAQGEVKAPLLTFSLNGEQTATVQNGDKIEVTISLNADPSQLRGAEGIFLSVAGTLDAPTAAHVWPIVVVTPDVTGGS